MNALAALLGLRDTFIALATASIRALLEWLGKHRTLPRSGLD